MTQCGVCHTDTHLRDGGYDLGSRGKMRLADRGVTYPLVMGHEVVGVVEEIGPDAVGVGIGDVRLIYPWVGCGTVPPMRSGTGQLLRRREEPRRGTARRVCRPHPRP